VPGTAWFLRQAALQFGLFTQRAPDETAMRAVLEHELAADRVA
jgi:shikimate 5-dehydrogenase